MNDRLQTAEWIICDLRSQVSSLYSTDDITFSCRVGFDGSARHFSLEIFVKGKLAAGPFADEFLDECFTAASEAIGEQAREEHEIMLQCQARADRDDAESRRCPL